jgi:hypothetical protein
MLCRIRIGSAEVDAEIRDPFTDHWYAEVRGARGLNEGPAMVEGLDGDLAGLTGEAEVFPRNPTGREPTALHGMRAFAKTIRSDQSPT